MAIKIKNNAFSLTEVLMAVGILSVGIMLVATMFPAAIYLTTVASEKTMASIVADEAFAKMQLYGFDVVSDVNASTGFVGYWVKMKDKINENEFAYPAFSGHSQYSWSALCQRLTEDPCDMRYIVKLYVARKTNPNMKYFTNAMLNAADSNKPVPVVADVNYTPPNKLGMKWGSDDFVNPPPSTAIVDNASGRIFRIISRDNDVVTLDRNWDKDVNEPKRVWFLPSGTTGTGGKPIGKNPDIEIFQRIIDFRKK